MRTVITRLLLTAVICAAALWCASADTRVRRALPIVAPEEGLNGTQRSEVLEMIEGYLRTNPDLLFSLIRDAAVRGRMPTTAPTALDQVTGQDLAALEDDLSDPADGNLAADAPVVIVEFFDYACPYSKAARAPMNEYLEAHPEVRHVYKELPILGPDSLLAAKTGLALVRQGGAVYQRYHHALMAMRGRLDEQAVLQAVTASGADLRRLAADLESPEVTAKLARTKALAIRLEIGSTPTYVVNGQILRGTPDAAALDKAARRPRGR